MRATRGMQSASAELANHLERVLEGKASLNELLQSPGDLASALEPCISGLYHFVADEDIRVKDAEYNEMQTSSMRRLIVLLRAGASPDQLAKVNFLGNLGS